MTQCDRQRPIGVFDSGVGGLTVARAIRDQLPRERLRYLGDTAHAPYGSQPIARVRGRALEMLDELVESGVKMLVIACNTASAACLGDARERYEVPVVEVIRPAVRRAAAATRSGRVGVIGTESTIRSRAYDDAFAAAAHVSLESVACPRFVDFVERGVTAGRQVLGLAQGYLEPLQRTGIDTLVLGCTHYPLLAGVIRICMGDGVTLVSSSEETAKDVLAALTETGMLADRGERPMEEFRSTGASSSFAALARRVFVPPMPAAPQPPASGHRDRPTTPAACG
jgi:glutamate racemase